MHDYEIKLMTAKAQEANDRATGAFEEAQKNAAKDAVEKIIDAITILSPTLNEALRRWGWGFHFDLLQEECGEAIVAVSHLRRGRCRSDVVMGEAADVIISAIAISLHDPVAFVKQLELKLIRLQERLETKERDKR